MLTAARQLRPAGLQCSVIDWAARLVADPSQPPLGIRIGEIGQAVVPHALGERTHLLHGGWVGLFVFGPWRQGAARVQGGKERWVVLLLVAGATQLPVGVRVGKVRYAVGPTRTPTGNCVAP